MAWLIYGHRLLNARPGRRYTKCITRRISRASSRIARDESMGHHMRILTIPEIRDALEDSVRISHFIILSLFLRVIKYNLNGTDIGENTFSYDTSLIFFTSLALK